MDLLPELPACNPPVYARGGHGQTLWSHFLPWHAPEVGGERHEIGLADGDRLVARFEPGTSGVLVHLLHGLTGDASADYIRGMAGALRAQGHGILAMNHRGCGEGAGLARGIYHSGRKEDVAACVAYGRELEPENVQVAVGVSLSGNALLLSLADETLPWPDAALALNPPIDLDACSVAIASGFSRLYEMRFLRRLRRLVKAREAAGLLNAPVDLPPRIGLRGFDEHFTASQAGFTGADDYYARCSAGPHLGKAKVPAAIITAADDPFVPVEGLKRATAGTPVALHVEESGGHVGYLAKGAKRWLEEAVPACVERLVAVARQDTPTPSRS